jgi:hypothetical protein
MGWSVGVSGQPDPSLTRSTRARLAAGLIVAALVGCASPANTQSPSAGVGSPAESGEPDAGNLPAGCEPIELRGPDGSPVELDGTWIDQSRDDAGQLTWWIRTEGDCLYGAATVDEVPEEGESMNPGTVLLYTGTIRPDFTIDGPMLHVGPVPAHAPLVPIYADVRLLIEFTDAGGIELREDRVPGVVTGGIRCIEQSFCFPPLILAPRDE